MSKQIIKTQPKSHILCKAYSTKTARLHSVRMTVSSTNGSGKTVYLCVKEIRLLFNMIHKNKLKIDWRPTCETRHYKTPRGKQAEHSNINCSNIAIFFGSIS